MPRVPKVILLIESSRAFGRALFRGVADYSRQHGPWSFLWEPAGLEKIQPLLKTGDADGIILLDAGQAEEIMAYGLPTVVVGHHKAGIVGTVNVVTDSEAIGRMAADHLLGCGFKHFAFCGYETTSWENTTWVDARRESFCRRIRAAGFENLPAFELSTTGKDWSSEWRSLANWLKALPKPVGVMACNDDCGQRVMEVCKLTGQTVPDLVGVVGTDNDEILCGLTDPPMSSIAINFERAGYDAAHALNGLMSQSYTVPPRIMAAATRVVARRSTDFVAMEDPHLAGALRFIRDQARRRGVSVDEIAGFAGLSRRMLENRFRKQLGRSVLDEIRRVRTDQIAQLLMETDLTVVQIADLLGFDDIRHIARYFRANKGISPLAYRKTHGSLDLSGWRSQNGDSFSQVALPQDCSKAEDN
jgi:LacI family transcriptional regulator